MGNAYTTQAKVIDEILDDVPAEALALIPGWIEDESRTIDAALPGYQTPFAASPGTPPIIEKAARFLVVDRLLRKLGLLRTDDDGRLVETYRRDAEKILKQLREGELIIPEVQMDSGKKAPAILPGATSSAPAKYFTESQFGKW